MKKFREEVAELEAQRQELTNAEKLFELPITMYPELLKVQKEMKGLEQIYDIYTEQKVCQSLSDETFVFDWDPECLGLQHLMFALTRLFYRVNIWDIFIDPFLCSQCDNNNILYSSQQEIKEV